MLQILTCTNTFRSPKINYGIGQEELVTADVLDMAAWTSHGIGRSNSMG